MKRLRFFNVVLIVSLLLGVGPARAEDQPSDSQKLSKAIKLYSDGAYAASRDLLREVGEDKLKTEDEQLQLQRYLSLTAKAIAGVESAKRSFDEGTAALKDDRRDDAKGSFASVLSNPFAPADLRSRAQSHLSTLNDKPAAGGSVSAPTQGALDQSSLVDELAREHELLWQKAVATYKDAARKIQNAVLAEDFAEARRLMDFARQTIELNRRYASPAAKYEAMRQQSRDMEAFIEDEQRSHDERLIKKEHDEINQREAERRTLVEATQQNQIEQFMGRAAELKKEGRFDEAIQVYDQVLAIDPNYETARIFHEDLGDLLSNTEARQIGEERDKQRQDLIVETDEAGIPWHDNLTYPKNWPEITARRLGGVAEAGESEENRQVRKQLRKVVPEIKFDAVPFEEVIDQLRALTGLNIVPNWSALEAAAIEKDAEVSLRLNTVKIEKALDLILNEVGAGEVELAYEIDDGVIQISTKDDLSRRTFVKVYNIQDLVVSVPTFRGRRINLENIGQNQQQGGLGGGRFLEGGGASGGTSGGLFNGGEQGDEEDQQDGVDPLQPIIDLIQETIDPESWRTAGGNVGSISSLQQQIIVTQTSTAHDQLRDLLQDLRRARALQVSVEARYITISRNWLEQIGVDLDIILNNGNAGFDRSTILDPATGNAILVPRQFTRNGFTPGAPGGIGITQPTQPFGQIFGQPGLVPGTGSVGPASGRSTPIPIVNNTLDLAAPSDTNINGSLGSLVNSTPAFQIFGSFLDNIQVDFLLRASQVDRRASDLDSPRLVLFNGQRATFESFIEQDYIAALQPVIGDNAGAFLPSVATALTGRSLDVQATVSADRRYVTMTVRTFTRVTGDFRTVFFAGSQTVGSGFIELATQTTQQIRTTVSVPDGGTLLIGGLKLSGERDVDAGVPILSRIPILKRAFSNTSNVKDDQVLLILLKPTIIIQDEAEADAFPTLSSLTSG
jgi:general secretion pathway protein D